MAQCVAIRFDRVNNSHFLSTVADIDPNLVGACRNGRIELEGPEDKVDEVLEALQSKLNVTKVSRKAA